MMNRAEAMGMGAGMGAGMGMGGGASGSVSSRQQVQYAASELERDRMMAQLSAGIRGGSGQLDLSNAPVALRKAVLKRTGDKKVPGMHGFSMALAPGVEESCVDAILLGTEQSNIYLTEKTAIEIVTRDYSTIHPSVFTLTMHKYCKPDTSAIEKANAKYGSAVDYKPSGPELHCFLDGLVAAVKLIDGGERSVHAAEIETLRLRVNRAKVDCCPVLEVYGCLRSTFMCYKVMLNQWCNPLYQIDEPTIGDPFRQSEERWRKMEHRAYSNDDIDPLWLGRAVGSTGGGGNGGGGCSGKYLVTGDGKLKKQGTAPWLSKLEKRCICGNWAKGQACANGSHCGRLCYETKNQAQYK